jgi:hypothetical protein
MRGVSRVLIVALLALTVLAVPTPGSSRSTLGKGFNFDLAAGSIDGHALLGARVSAVRHALGRPSAYNLHKRYGSFRYGPRSGRATVIFRVRNGRLRVTAIAITSRAARETRVGRILRRDPWQLQRTITRGYADTFRLVKPYGCPSARLPSCSGLFKSIDGKTNLSFGHSGSQRYLVLFA